MDYEIKNTTHVKRHKYEDTKFSEVLTNYQYGTGTGNPILKNSFVKTFCHKC